MKKLAVVVVLVFAVTLAVVVGQRLSAEAMAVVVGVICGVVAGIPTSAFVMLMANRRDQRVERMRSGGMGAEPYGAYPPVVVIQGGTPATLPTPSAYYPAHAAAGSREFHVVGVDHE
jgi:hypothetical protein